MAIGNSALAWLERVASQDGPLYLAIVRALEQATLAGELQPGDRLPPQRELAQRLGVDLTTITRAYSVARTLGLLEGAVGRGSFVRARTEDDEAGLVDLTMNLPPPPEGLSLGAMLQETVTAILQRADPAVLMAYHPGFGAPGQRRAGAEWLAPCLGERSPDCLLVSPGAQAALAAVLGTLCRPGDTVVAEPLTYPGFTGVAAQLGLRVVACASDEQGVIPEALEAVCARERPAAVYLVPTMQNPTAVTMPPKRRREAARVVSRAGAWLVEDDPYSRLMEAPPAAVSSFHPGRSVYIGTLAKTLSPGLRIAYIACPSADDAARFAEALRAIALMPAPLMAAVASTWIREGRAEKLLAAVRAEARARRALAARILPAAAGPPESLHVWLPLPPGRLGDRSPEALRLAAQRRGLALVTHEAFATTPDAPAGMRLSLGGPGRRLVLEGALRNLAELLATSPPASGWVA
jgi:DNA-binding transcriptional MocR family regulator